MGLHARDWKNLLDLAHLYGWRPGPGYDLQEAPQIVSSSHARALVEALSRALQDLPTERRKELRLTDIIDTSAEEGVWYGPDPDPKGYFSWKRRWIVAEFIALCQQGALEIRRI